MRKKLVEIVRNSQFWGFFVSVAVMAVISLAFFYPDNFEGNSLGQADIEQGMANSREGADYEAATGEKALWTNSLFGGMPTFQISPRYPSNDLFTWLTSVYGLGLPSPSDLLFMMMFGFLILLFTMKLRWYYCLLGAIAWGFSSYFVIIIGAGHIWKFVTLAYIPPTIAGLIMVYRGRYVTGAALLALFAMLQLNANHPQMSYYFFFVMLALVIAMAVIAYRRREMRRWWIATGVSLGCGLLALGANLPSLYNTYEYSKETKRSQSELTPLTPADAEADVNADRPTGGMPREQIVGWSYGRSESLSLLVPNIKGGASARPEDGRMNYLGLDKLPDAAQYQGTAAGSLLPYLSQYFNDSEGTNGPVYVGALIFALFLLGCFIVRGPVKWALLIVTLLSVLLALGRNFESLTDLMIYHFPLYNKFRAVESILVIAEFAMPLLAILALKKLFTTEDALRVFRRPLLWSFGVCVMLCLVILAWPSIFGDAVTSGDYAVSSNIQQQVARMCASYSMTKEQTDAALYEYSINNPATLSAIESLRYGLVRADALRSLLFICLGAGLIYFTLKGSIKAPAATLLIAATVLVDLYGVDKRYVSHSSFAVATAGQASPFAFEPDETDRAILADTAASYRVMDIPGFDEARRSYHHKMIGGYHAAKLNRYEDLIQRRLNPLRSVGYYPELRDDSVARSMGADAEHVANLYQTLDMLNARYIITGDDQAPVVRNDYALGNAWLVDSVVYVDGADAEMAALDRIDVSRTAVADSRFREALGENVPSAAPGDTVVLTSYSPNTLKYHVTTAAGGLAVFSEVYFPWGWHAAVDGEPVAMGRVNYLLRAVRLPAGSHELTMTFDPESIHTTSAVAYASVSLIYLLLLAGIFVEIKRCGLLSNR